MTAMARRRPITSHPAFAPLIALWFAALLGLTVAVLPAATLERGLAAAGLGELAPLTLAARVAVGAIAALLGGLVGYALTRRFIQGAGEDPRPLYAEAEPEPYQAAADPLARRRPLRVREELADGLGDESQVVSVSRTIADEGELDAAPPPVFAAQAQAREGFMILTPQPIHPPHPPPDLDALLEQFDSAFAAFQAGEAARTNPASVRPGADPVQAFVAQQTGTPGPSASPSPMGGLVPDHQAELRAALDKLARSQGKV